MVNTTNVAQCNTSSSCHCSTSHEVQLESLAVNSGKKHESASKCGCSNDKLKMSKINLFTNESVFEGLTYDEISAQILERLSQGGLINANEAAFCLEKLPLDTLVELAHQVTLKVASVQVSLCSITNVKSGLCPQDCKWCAQSAHFKTNAEVYDVKDKEQCLKEAQACYDKGVEMFSLVASGKKPSEQELNKLIEIIDHIKAHVPIKLCASLGLLDETMLQKLKEHGIERYHCNLETAPSYFGNLVTRHSIFDKINTLKAAQNSGLELCSGGIIGMGESDLDRLELALALRELNIKSIPINVLHPIEGTPLYGQQMLTDEQILRAICIFRLVNPDAYLRFAGGRALLSENMVNKAIYCGINAAIVGDLLTTLGSDIKSDRQRFAKHHYNLPDIPHKK